MEIITETGQPFDITPGYSFDFEFINPLLSDVGSQTAPGTLPYTPRNLRLLGFPDRIDNAGRPLLKRNVTIRHGAFQKPATQVTLKASLKDKIVTTFYLDEAIFYEKIKAINMNEIDYGTPREMSVQQLFALCQQVMLLQRVDDFYIFPVISNYDVEKGQDTSENVWLNKIHVNWGTGAVTLLDQSLFGIIVDGTPVAVPYGYGVTPFLKLSFVIRKVIEHLGYTLVSNIFDSNRSLRQLVLVNNVADAIVKGKLDYTQLVPTCTVSDFIKSLQNKFGLRFLANELTRTITIALLDDQLATLPDLDLTPFATEKPRVEWSAPSRLHISAATSIPGAVPATSSLDDLIRQYGPVNFIHYSTNPGRMEFGKLYYVYSENTFLVHFRMGPGKPSVIKRFSPCFDYTSPGEGALLEIASPDEQLPMFRLHFIDPVHGDDSRDYCIAPSIVETVLVNSTLVYSDDDDTVQQEKKYTIPLMFCFALPALQKSYGAFVPAGTTGPYDTDGTGWGDFTLNITWNYGLKGHFYNRYERMLASSYHPVNCLLKLPLSRLQTLDLTTPKLLFNQPVLIERIKCRVGDAIFEVTECSFRTIKPYLD